MSHYVYLMSDHTRTKVHSGYSNDIRKTLDFFDGINELTLNFKPTEQYLNRLVMVEVIGNEGQAIDRMTYLTHLPLKMKAREIERNNPDWMDLTTASNFDL